MQVVILCGGRGTRMGSGDLPKAMFPIGGKPILWHIMSMYAFYGFSEFILCLGYKGKAIKDYFKSIRNWKVTFVDTGLDTNTGGRIYRARKYIKNETFFATYGDGLADVDLRKLAGFHNNHRRMATLTAVKPSSPFGIVGIDASTNVVTHFEEKPILDHWINGGFFVFDREVFRYIRNNDILEKDSFSRMLKNNNLNAYKHAGFWECMDTYKDNLRLNSMWDNNLAPWAVWRRK